MNGEELKRKVKAGGIVYGTMLASARNPRWMALIDTYGLDYVIIDTEHTPLDRGHISDFLAAFNDNSVVPILRVPIPDSHYVTMALDAGAQGVLVPYCETVEEVKAVVAAAKWRPLKGALVRKIIESGEFPSEATRAYLEDRNRNAVCIIGIESVPGIDNLDAIFEVDGIDAIFVGPNDLSISLGIPDQYDHPKYEEALRRIISICNNHNTPMMFHHQTVEMTTKWLREGVRFVLYSSDQSQMREAFLSSFSAIKEVGQELGGDIAEEIGESKEVL